MNNVLQLKGRMDARKGAQGGGPARLPKSNEDETGNKPNVESKKVLRLVDQLEEIKAKWSDNSPIRGVLVDVNYRTTIAKSNRIREIFRKSPKSSNDTVVGARFGEAEHHIITHHVDMSIINKAIKNLRSVATILDAEFGGIIENNDLEKIKLRKIVYADHSLSESRFCQLVVDSYYVSDFKYPERDAKPSSSIVTLYKVSDDMLSLLQDMNITTSGQFGDATFQINKTELEKLYNRAPYLIAMSVKDINSYIRNENGEIVDSGKDWREQLPPPNNEPTVGVIDTPMDPDGVYFEKWVTYEPRINKAISISKDDLIHGSAVSSIVVDGPSLNPDLDDGCGRFRVKHFGIALDQDMSSYEIMNQVKTIIEENPDIKVWNFSLGSVREVEKSSISPEAAMLDKIQRDYKDILFVVSGTNDDSSDKPGEKCIGSPADSLNSLVVNAVNEHNEPAVYSRKGDVLSFFKKPDLTTFGGDKSRKMYVCTSRGRELMAGTSFAAPWITRKAAFMMEVLGLSREVTKALLIDSAADWDDVLNDKNKIALMGYGVVPTHIRDVVQSKDNEIKFVIEKTSELYDTYTYSLPVPVDNNKHPFIAKATLCYFPECSINQGVDYTNTELDIYIGRIENIAGKEPRLKPIDKNKQSIESDDKRGVSEKTARSVFRKWDNTKHIREVMKDKLMPRKAYGNGMWGISVKRKNRIQAADGDKLKFGLVVTFREVNGVNRINEFIHRCSLHNWLVNQIDIENSLDIYARSQEIIEL